MRQATFPSKQPNALIEQKAISTMQTIHKFTGGPFTMPRYQRIILGHRTVMWAYTVREKMPSGPVNFNVGMGTPSDISLYTVSLLTDWYYFSS